MTVTSIIWWEGGHSDAGVADGLVSDGAWASFTVTLKVLVAPEVEVVVTVVVPTGKNDPDAGLVVSTPQLPVDVAAGKLTIAPH